MNIGIPPLVSLKYIVEQILHDVGIVEHGTMRRESTRFHFFAFRSETIASGNRTLAKRLPRSLKGQLQN